MMTGPLSPRVHGYIDYGSVVFLLLSPMLFGFGGVPATLCYLFAGALLVLSLITAYPLGVAKVVPFTIHGLIEAVSAVGLVLAPFLFGFSDVVAARNFFLVAGVALGIVFLVTNYKAAERPRRLIGTQRRITT
jgi:hypothetical protein